MANKDLNKAKAAKKDEFYTRLEDIELELKHYRHHFKGKKVLCNCDDPRCSNFFRYFTLNFEVLGLKKVIATCYKNQDVDLFSQHTCEKAVYQIYEGDKNHNRKVDENEIEVKYLEGDGDFRSKECVALLEESDIVVTNPPFSLFRDFVALLVQYNKQFLIIGSQNAIKYKEIFPLIQANKIWLGTRSGNMEFTVPNDSEPRATRFWIDKNGQKWRSLGNICWFTNLEHDKRHEELPLFKKYTPQEYPTYINFNAIEVSKVGDIPCDYDGLMGVPITFMDKYNPDQFEIIGMSLDLAETRDEIRAWYLSRPEEKQKRTGNDAFYIKKDGKLVRLYDRIVIRRKVGAQ